MNKADVLKRVDTAIARLDAWANVATNLGMRGRDKRMSAYCVENFITQTDAEAMYQADDVAARIVDRPAEDMVREGFKIKFSESNDKAEAYVASELKRLNWKEREVNRLKWGRLYGTANMIIGVQGEKPEQPLELKNIKKIDYLAVLDRYSFSSPTVYTKDLGSVNFNYPELYQITTTGNAETMNNVHWTRVLRYDGVKLPPKMRSRNNGWGDTIYSRIVNALRNFHTGHDSLATSMTDFNQLVFNIAGLADLIASGEEELVTKRFELMTGMSSICNALVLQEGETVERKVTSLQGIADIITKIDNRLVAATDMPHTVLLGQSPSGLGATGNSEKIDYYDHIKNLQEATQSADLIRLVTMILSQADSPVRGKTPEFSIEFNSLWQMDKKELAETHRLQAEADEKYVGMGALSPDEVAESRFGGDGYSLETKIDISSRAALNKAGENQAGAA